MIVYCRVALNAQVPEGEQHRRDLADYEKTTLQGEGSTWEAAKASVTIPAGAVVLAWAQYPI